MTKMPYCFAVAALLMSQTALAAQLQDVSSFSDGAACASLLDAVKSHLQFELIDVPTQHTAGQRYAGTLRLTKNFNLSADDWEQDYSFSAIRLTIETPYPHIFNAAAQPNLVDFFFADDHTAAFSFSKDIAAHVGGDFELELSLSLASKHLGDGYCTISGRFGRKINIESEDVHLVPPLLRSLVLDKPSYRPGERVTAKFTLSSPLENLETDHFEWINPDVPPGDPDRGFPAFESNVFRRMTQNGDGSYTVAFKIPRCAKAGTYYLKYFNRSDKYGNFESEVGGHDATELAVSLDAPVIVK